MFDIIETTSLNSIADFDAWSGGYSWLETFKKHPACIDYIDNELEAWGDGCSLSSTEVNDYLWFDALEGLEEAGLYNGETGLFYDENGFEDEDDDWE